MDNYQQPYGNMPNMPTDVPPQTPYGSMPPQQFAPATQPYAPVPPVSPDRTRDVMSVGEYIGMFILSAIPIVNLICWIVWLCSSKTNKNKKNYIIATIIMTVIAILLSVIAGVIIAVTGVSLMDLYY